MCWCLWRFTVLFVGYVVVVAPEETISIYYLQKSDCLLCSLRGIPGVLPKERLHSVSMHVCVRVNKQENKIKGHR